MRTNNFVKAMKAFENSKHFTSFLAKEEERLEISFFPVAKMAEESRFISYLNYLVKHRSVRPEGLEESFFQVWKDCSGYMPFVGKNGPTAGKNADMNMVREGVEFAAEILGIEINCSKLTQEDWDKDFQYWEDRLFGQSEESTNAIPF
jgi:hypothetical protein